MSEPSAKGTIEEATAEAAPPLDPPADLDESNTLAVTPNNLFLV